MVPGTYNVYLLAADQACPEKYVLWQASLNVMPQDITESIQGTVTDEQGLPISAAIVTIPATDRETMTDKSGSFYFDNLYSDAPLFISAWAPGYYIGGGKQYPLDKEAIISLAPFSEIDHPEYEFISAFTEPGEDNGNCQICHAGGGSFEENLVFDEWILDAHAKSAINERFLTMYQGTDIHGNKSPLTNYIEKQDYGRFPLPPDFSKPNFGPGYKLDFPYSNGNCAACHAPIAAMDNPLSTDVTALTDNEKEGINCDFCHKIMDVKLYPVTNRPAEGKPGVLSFDIVRPEEGHQIFIGPLKDVAPGEDTYAPVMQQGRYCAPCHSAKFWGTQIYDSYGEWNDSVYSEPTGNGYMSCQDCHMPKGLTDHFARMDKGGRIRPPETIASHKMLGIFDEIFMEEAVSMDVKAERTGDILQIDVSITNDNTGHHFPTGSPLRNVLLVVAVSDENGTMIPMQSGDTLPEWAGDLAGKPGRGFAKILQELWTGISPTGAYWNPTEIISDTRLSAFDSDYSIYSFLVPEGNTANIHVRLLYRRAFQGLQELKDWKDNEILINEWKKVVD